MEEEEEEKEEGKEEEEEEEEKGFVAIPCSGVRSHSKCRD